ncbi:uncharacterized protein LOC113515160 [Galleria mellonella]|uniref:Uncharacterized protein LOC113515160 n=1 Tax=Galleria mellonella TaxID=7137 RepID=A0ABM3N3R7_GALME|nr:uncharacterized protein LOC113515160 [Galleria mellonella]
MASNVIKCNSCNVVINEVLAFIINKVDVMDEKSIHLICNSAFSPEDISTAKSMLFDSIPTAKRKIRRKQGKNVRELDDIIDLIKSTNTEDMPIFVAKDLHKLPPVTFDHVDVTGLLKDIVMLKTDLKHVHENYVTVDDYNQLKMGMENLMHASVLNDFQYINKKRGAQFGNSFTCDSGPMGLQNIPVSNTDEKICDNKILSPQKNTKSVMEGTTQTLDYENQQRMTVSIEKPVSSAKTAPTMNVKVTGVRRNRDRSRTMAEVLSPTNTKEGEQIVTKNDWTYVTKKKVKKYRFIGQLGKASTDANGRFKAAEIKVPLFISNVSKDTKEEDISEYIKKKTGDIVTLHKINTKKERSYNCYKLFVSKNKIQQFLNDEIWPDGISFRRYVYLKHPVGKGENNNNKNE